MNKRLFIAVIVSIMLLMSACGDQTVIKNQESKEVVTVEETESKSDADEVISESETSENNQPKFEIASEQPPVIRVENPSWEYYNAQNVQSETKPFEIKLLEESPNEITDTDEWFTENGLQVTGNIDEEKYGCMIENEGLTVSVTQEGTVIAQLDFSEYMYAPDMVEEDRDFVDERVHDAKIRNNVLYVSIFHPTYAKSAPYNAYLMAISLEDYSVIWKSEPLVSNTYNFEIVDDIIFTGYGFTSEPDCLIQLDRLTGCVLEQYELKSKADYIIYKEDKLHVRTYNTDYVFEVNK